MIVQSVPNSFKQELILGIHDFTTSTGDVFKLALFTSSASLNANTTAYSATNEVTGTGYVAGGAALVNVTPVVSNGIGIVSFSDVTWPASTITARGGMIYNSSKANRAVLILDFGSDRTTSATTFTVTFPAATSDSAILRLS